MINRHFPQLHRRDALVGGSALWAAMWSTPGAFADLIATPSQTEGPFYPNRMPLDTDNDLIVINDAITPALGEMTHVSGRVLSKAGLPIRNAFVEIWQVDHNAVYIHTEDRTNRENQDHNFQGYGRFLTDHQGRYYFRTIKPVPYPGRTPHIHFAVSKNGRRILTTQLYVKGHPNNARDRLLNRIPAKSRDVVLGDFRPIEDSPIGELAVEFDIILGIVPDDHEADANHGLGKSQWRRRS